MQINQDRIDFLVGSKLPTIMVLVTPALPAHSNVTLYTIMFTPPCWDIENGISAPTMEPDPIAIIMFTLMVPRNEISLIVLNDIW